MDSATFEVKSYLEKHFADEVITEIKVHALGARCHFPLLRNPR
jgi:hypothetical protein